MTACKMGLVSKLTLSRMSTNPFYDSLAVQRIGQNRKSMNSSLPVVHHPIFFLATEKRITDLIVQGQLMLQ